MPYEPYTNVFSGKTAPFIKGLLPLDESGADVIAYRKDLTVAANLNLLGSSDSIDLTGEWQVRIRESDARGEDGGYVSKVLFEQTVKWTATIIAVNIGGISLVTWLPRGDQRTSIVNGEECAVVQNINAPTVDEMEAYGKTGAWRFLDTGINFSNSTPEQKYAAENGFTIFKDEGAAVIGSYHFYATWQCRFYKCEVPQGAILETVYDRWQSVVLTEALYKVSWKKGTPGSDPALFDERTGQRFWARIESIGDSKVTNIYRSRRGLSPLTWPLAEWAGTVDKLAIGGARLFMLSAGALLCIGTNQIRLKAYISTDCGKSWTKIMDEIGNITILASCLTLDTTRFSIYGKDGDGAPKYVILKHEEDGWRLSESGTPSGTELPVKGVSTMIAGEGGIIRMMVRDDHNSRFRVLVSSDGGKSYDDELVEGETREDV